MVAEMDAWTLSIFCPHACTAILPSDMPESPACRKEVRKCNAENLKTNEQKPRCIAIPELSTGATTKKHMQQIAETASAIVFLQDPGL